MAGPPGGCSVRRLTQNGLADTGPVMRVLQALAKPRGLTLLAAQPMLLHDVKIAGVVARDQSGNRVELFTLSIFTFHGQPPAELMESGDDGRSVVIYLGRGASTLPLP
jgi:hypothetical protein